MLSLDDHDDSLIASNRLGQMKVVCSKCVLNFQTADIKIVEADPTWK